VDDSSSPHQGPQDLLAAVTLSHVALAHEVGMLLVPHMQRSLVWSQPLTPHWSPATIGWRHLRAGGPVASTRHLRAGGRFASPCRQKKGSPKSD